MRASCRADVDEQSKKEIKDLLLSYDRTLLVADPRRCEPKKCVRARRAALPFPPPTSSVLFSLEIQFEAAMLQALCLSGRLLCTSALCV